MKGSQRRKFAYGVAQHTCIRGVRSSVLFYTVEDYLWYLTLYSCLSNKYDVVTLAFCIMPNHTHEIVSCASMQNLVLFRHELERLFSREYNRVRGLNGTEFRGPFANSLKPAGKRLKGSLIYVINNPVAGLLCKRALDYSWNLLAYHDSNTPFSEPIQMKHRSLVLTSAMNLVNHYSTLNYPLYYNVQKAIFSNLTETERMQIIDYIVTKYRFMDYNLAAENFGSFENMLTTADVSEGAEFDLKEEWEDYSCYQKMSTCAQTYGLLNAPFNPVALPEYVIQQLYRDFHRLLNGYDKQIRRYLRL